MTNCPWGWPQCEQWPKRSQLWWKQRHGRAIMFDLTRLMRLGQSCSDRIKARLSPMGPIRQMRTICACSSGPFVQSRRGQIVKGPGMAVVAVLEKRGSINMIKSAHLQLHTRTLQIQSRLVRCCFTNFRPVSTFSVKTLEQDSSTLTEMCAFI